MPPARTPASGRRFADSSRRFPAAKGRPSWSPPVTDRAARVLLVDDHPLTRDGLRMLLSSRDGPEVCGEAGTLEDARLSAFERRPDPILLHLRLPDGNGLDLLEEVRGWDDPPAVLVASACAETSPEVSAAYRLGAAGFVGKSTPAGGVLAAVRQALAGNPVLPGGLIARLVRRRGHD